MIVGEARAERVHHNGFVSVSRKTKVRWFNRGAAAFERTFPGFNASSLGAEVGPVYVCPLCDQAFTPAARKRPDCVLGDRGYDAVAIRRGLQAHHIVPLLAMRRTEHGSGLGR